MSAEDEEPAVGPSGTEKLSSAFWENLGSEHAEELKQHGFDDVKRRQALRYFTWRWGPRRLWRSEQLRFLASHSRPGLWLEAIRGGVEEASEWAPLDWSASERWFYTVAVRLLWDYASRDGDPDVIALEEPSLGAPLPVRFRGRLISQDLANSALEVHAIRRALRGREPKRILEVGAGYGRSAYTLLKLYPRATYTIIDIEPARSISAWYLGRLFGPDRVRSVDPDAVGDLAADEFDLAISISSMQEMTHSRVRSYLQLLDRIVSGTVFLKQWRSWENPDDGITSRFADYPIPSHWQRRFNETAPVQSNFVQAAWELAPSVAQGAGV